MKHWEYLSLLSIISREELQKHAMKDTCEPVIQQLYPSMLAYFCQKEQKISESELKRNNRNH